MVFWYRFFAQKGLQIYSNITEIIGNWESKKKAETALGINERTRHETPQT